MYESRSEKPIPRPRFARRVLVHFAIAQAIVGVSLGIGMVGYVCFERFSWTDAFLNVSMLLGGMGPVNPPVTQAGKVFAGFFRAVCRTRVHRHCGAAVHATASPPHASISLGRQVMRIPMRVLNP